MPSVAAFSFISSAISEFVLLKRADKVFFARRIKGEFVAEFLRVIFADIFESRGNRFVNFLRRDELRRAEQSNFFSAVVPGGNFGKYLF